MTTLCPTSSAIRESFDKANLKGYEIQGSAIRVPRDPASHVQFPHWPDAKVLNQDFGDAQLDAVNGGSFMDIGTERDQADANRKQKELQQTICLRPGISYAKVIFDVDKGTGFKDKAMTALVSVKRGRLESDRRGNHFVHQRDGGACLCRIETRERRRLGPQRPHVVRRPEEKWQLRGQRLSLLEADL